MFKKLSTIDLGDRLDMKVKEKQKSIMNFRFMAWAIGWMVTWLSAREEQKLEALCREDGHAEIVFKHVNF
jgi:hypothetical protein